MDKRVPIALIVTLTIQLMAGIWWASSLAHDVSALKDDVNQLHLQFKEQAQKAERVVSLQADMRNMVGSVERIERTLEMLVTETYGRSAKQARK